MPERWEKRQESRTRRLEAARSRWLACRGLQSSRTEPLRRVGRWARTQGAQNGSFPSPDIPLYPEGHESSSFRPYLQPFSSYEPPKCRKTTFGSSKAGIPTLADEPGRNLVLPRSSLLKECTTCLRQVVLPRAAGQPTPGLDPRRLKPAASLTLLA